MNGSTVVGLWNWLTAGDATMPLWAALAVVGALIATFGLGELLGARVVNWTPPAEPADVTSVRFLAGFDARFVGELRAESFSMLGYDAGAGPHAPRGPSGALSDMMAAGPTAQPDPADRLSGRAAAGELPAAFQAIVLEPAGRWGDYWHVVARCEHEHPTRGAAYYCAEGLIPPAGAILGVGVAE